MWPDGWSLALRTRGAAHRAPRRGSSGRWRQLRTADVNPFSLGTLWGARRGSGFRKAVVLVLVLVCYRCWELSPQFLRSFVGMVLACWLLNLTEEAGMLHGIQPKL